MTTIDGRIDTIFTKVVERRDIVDFIREIEKNPCLYDRTTTEYANKIHIKRAWTAIAKKSNTSVLDCREKWRKIRISFIRSLKLLQSDKPPMRPYYLADDLKFLLPFVNQKKPENPSSPNITDTTDDCIESVEFEVANVPVSKQEVISDTDSFEIESVYTNRDTPNQRHAVANPIEVNELNGHNIKLHANEYKNERCHQNIENNPRKMFLLSILPDVESFSEQEMRVFRRETVRVIDNIIDQRDPLTRKHL